jgi:hypothetical protein
VSQGWWAQWWAHFILVRHLSSERPRAERETCCAHLLPMFAVVGDCPGVAREFVDLDLRAQNNDASCAH